MPDAHTDALEAAARALHRFDEMDQAIDWELNRDSYMRQAQAAIAAYKAHMAEAGWRMMPSETEYPLLTLHNLREALETDGPRGTWVCSDLDECDHEYSISSMSQKRSLELPDDFRVVTVVQEYPGASAATPLKMFDLRLATRLIEGRYDELMREAEEWANALDANAAAGGGDG